MPHPRWNARLQNSEGSQSVAYDELPIVSVAVADLRLDLENYRIPTRRDDEAAALNYLFASEDVIGAAKLIIRDGYFDNEVPVVIEEYGEYVVLEGNRRVSALKALADPSLVPSHRSEVEALLRRYDAEAANLPTVIRVIVAPTRDAAAPHIARLHTGLTKKAWSLDQQATFYYSLLGDGTTVDDIKARFPGVKVVRFIQMATMRRFVAAAKFADASLRDFVTGDRLAMSAFEYAYRRPGIAAAIGVDFDSDGHLRPVSLAPERIGAALAGQQLNALEYLMTEFRAGRLNTRSPDLKADDPAHWALVAKLRGEKPQPTAPESPEPEDREHDPNPEPPGGPDPAPSPAPPTPSPTPPRGPNSPDTKRKLQLNGLDYTTHTTANLQRRYIELRRIEIDELPAAAAMLLRSVLETTAKHHFDSTPTRATGELAATFDVVHAVYGKDKALKSAINTIRSGSTDTPGSIKWFNAVSHDANRVPTAETVRQAFSLLTPVLKHLLLPPGLETGA